MPLSNFCKDVHYSHSKELWNEILFLLKIQYQMLRKVVVFFMSIDMEFEPKATKIIKKLVIEKEELETKYCNLQTEVKAKDTEI